jgi:hypothetical protein
MMGRETFPLSKLLKQSANFVLASFRPSVSRSVLSPSGSYAISDPLLCSGHWLLSLTWVISRRETGILRRQKIWKDY